MAFSQGVSGLSAAASQLDTIGNNIANSQTVGYKNSRAEFADIYAGAKAGLGVKVAGVTQNFNSGSLETTDRNLDLAIDGGGFFRLNDGNQVTYSRNGQFQMDSEGYLVNNTGAQLMGYPVDDPDAANPQVLAGAQPVALQVPAGDIAASATTAGEMTFNLDSGDEIKNGAFDPADADTYNWQTSLTTHDSLGNSQIVNLYFTKTASNEWQVNTRNNGVDAGSETLEFNERGELTEGSPLELSIADMALNNGAEAINATIDLASVTQNSNAFEAKNASQNGYAAGSLTGVSIAENGNVIGNYSNNQTRALGAVALASFRNEQGLQPIGNNMWAATGDSGQALLGSAGTGQLGSLLSGTLEQSNVDLSKELVNMIVAQRNYQANAQTIKVQDQILQTAVTLR